MSIERANADCAAGQSPFSMLDTPLKKRCAASPTAGGSGGGALPSMVLECGSVICSGIVGGLLSSFPLSRLHKSAVVLAHLAALAGTQHATAGANAPAALLAGWLSEAACACQLAEAAQRPVTQLWPAAALEAADGLRAPAREQGLASRRLKKLLREFADTHARDS
mmetsp:Transcript_7210/g.21931  ORF Transcript_7210/g.21931 Transcript_7210/m.21931 type:complete len:166 (+) Transcript_7210:791-1288(+)